MSLLTDALVSLLSAVEHRECEKEAILRQLNFGGGSWSQLCSVIRFPQDIFDKIVKVMQIGLDDVVSLLLLRGCDFCAILWCWPLYF